MYRKSAIVFAIILSLGLGACSGREEPATDTAESTDTATATHPASPGGTALVPETQAGTTVLVALNDGSIAVTNSDAISAGTAVFTITNASQNMHNLFIEGPGVNKAAGNDLAGAATSNVEVDLTPGEYTLYCPILDHRTKGEEVKLTIKPADAPAPSSATAPAA